MTDPDRLTRTAKRLHDWRRAHRHIQPPPNLVHPERLREARLASGLTTRQAAARFGVSRDTYKDWEQGVKVPGQQRQAALLRWIEARLAPKSRTVKRRGGVR